VDMSHLSRTLARDNTARNCSQGRKREGLRQAKGATVRSGEEALNDHPLPAADPAI
jgi:hypothetical protein